MIRIDMEQHCIVTPLLGAPTLQTLAPTGLCHCEKGRPTRHQVSKVMCGAACWKDHRLAFSTANLRLHPKRCSQGKKTAKRLNVSSLKSVEAMDKLFQDFESRLNNDASVQQDVEEAWKQLCGTGYSTAAERLGHTTHKQQGCFE